MQSTHRRDGGRILAIALGTLALTCVLAAILLLTAPAGLAARMVAAAAPDVRLLAPSGRLVEGSADLLIDGHDLGRLTWHLTPSRLLAGAVEGDVTLGAVGHEGRARLAISRSGTAAIESVSARIHEDTLDALLRPYAIEPTGEIELSRGQARAELDPARLTDADAHARWSGGVVRYRLGGTVWAADFPPLDADLTVRDGAPVVVVRDRGGAELLDVTLRADGWIDLRVRYRFVALAGYPWPDPPAPDVFVVEISERLL